VPPSSSDFGTVWACAVACNAIPIEPIPNARARSETTRHTPDDASTRIRPPPLLRTCVQLDHRVGQNCGANEFRSTRSKIFSMQQFRLSFFQSGAFAVQVTCCHACVPGRQAPKG